MKSSAMAIHITLTPEASLTAKRSRRRPHRQGLIERWRATPAEAIKRLTPLQAQHPPAPFIALAARLHEFKRADLDRRSTTARREDDDNRLTLHLAAARTIRRTPSSPAAAPDAHWRKIYAHLDEERVTQRARRVLQARPARTPRSANACSSGARPLGPWNAVIFVRSLLPLIQLPPAGYWDDPRRAGSSSTRARCPKPHEAAKTVLTRYLAAFGPASKKDIANWAGVAQQDFDFDAIPTVTFKDEHGTTLYDLPGRRSRRPTPTSRRACSATGTSRCSPTRTASASSRPSSSRWRSR